MFNPLFLGTALLREIALFSSANQPFTPFIQAAMIIVRIMIPIYL
jgi:hypothetical protein